MAYLNTFSVIPARPAFGSKLETSESSYYIESKAAKATFCNVLKCPQKIKVKNQSDLIAIRRAKYVNTLRCKPPYTNYALNNNLYTKMDFLANTCIINTLAKDTCPNTSVNPSNSFFNTYYIDPNGSLFGNTQCGYSNFLQFRRLYTQYFKPTYIPIVITGEGYIETENDIFKIFTFNNNGSIVFKSSIQSIIFNVNYIVVGGGGGGAGGGYGGGGGGGGGQVQYGTLQQVTDASFSVIVGNGGSGGAGILDGPSGGTNGLNSSINGSVNMTSLGGFGGESPNISVAGYGGNGGNSGGGGIGGAGSKAGYPDSGNGTNGGGGGGGSNVNGAGGNGSNITLPNPNFMNTITNYGAGGGGGSQGFGGNNAGNGVLESAGTNGVPNFGGGGGAGDGGGGKGGNGGSGVVIFYLPK